MAEVRIKRHVKAPPEKVFEVAADFPNAAEFINGISKMEMLTEEPVRVGTRFRETRVMFKREATEEMEITAFDPPRSYALGCVSHGCRYHTVMSFTRHDGGTDLEMNFQATPLTLFAKVMSVVMSPMMKKLAETCGKDLDDVKAAVESR